MDELIELVIEMFPYLALNKDADKVLSEKPNGVFAPIKKRNYRKECENLLNSYDKLSKRKKTIKKVSSITQSRIDRLKDEVRK